MKTITYETNPQIDKTGWPPGEWDNEPDKKQWEDKATGLPCLAVRNRMGAWCGYVGVPKGHRFHGMHYDEVHLRNEIVEDPYPPAHGGLTFADTCMEGAPEAEGVCHVPEPGEPDDVWWLGFDCLHGGDLAPGMIRFHLMVEETLSEEQRQERKEYGWRDWETYKPLSYVQDQCADLAAWLKSSA